MSVALAYADTQPAPVAVCSCTAQYDRRAFDALALAAGHRGKATPMLGLIVRVCARCTSSVSEEVWADGYEDDAPDDPVCVAFDRWDGDRHDEREWKEARAWKAE